jgi:hypothetical protein
MPWRYGIVKYRHKKDRDFRFYGIGELYYDKDPLSPHSCTDNPVEPYAELEEFLEEEDSVKADIKRMLERMIKDCEKYPIFDVDGPYAKSTWGVDRSEIEPDSEDGASFISEAALKDYFDNPQEDD